MVDESSEGEEGMIIEGLVIGQDLNRNDGTCPSARREPEFRLESRERRVVLPAPEGPIMANI